MSYVECPKCGLRALSVATQCPHCGLDFLTQPAKRLAPEPEAPRLPPQLLRGAGAVLALALVVVLVVALVRHLGGPKQAGMAPPASLTVDSAPPAPARSAKEEPSAVLPDSAKSTPARDTVRPVAPPPSVASPPKATPPKVTPSPTGSQLLRYTTDFVNVRRARDPKAAVVRVLKRGQAVQADSLKEQWYRVLLDGQPIGYVYRGYLTSTPPRSRP